ncbi:8610_t:CDS:2, partial [Racocetra persica]
KQWVRCTTNVKINFENDVNINKLYDSETINIQQNSLKEIEGWEVVIKNLNDSSNIAEDFFDEWNRHFSFQKSCEIFNVWRSSDELNYSSTELNSSTPIHPKAIYTSRHHKYTNLPDPVNSIKIPHFDMEKYS